MRAFKIAPGEYYHVYNRGNRKQPLFKDTRDWARFLFLVLYLQSPLTLYNISRFVSSYVKHSVFNINQQTVQSIIMDRRVELICFTLMPNHFHLLVKEHQEGGISQYMQRVLNGYTKYFNKKYNQSGHLFQGPFQYKHVRNNEQFLHTSAYIHRNPVELRAWKHTPETYRWSSYQDYAAKNRWGNIIVQDSILEQFNCDPAQYHSFVKTSGTKMHPNT